MCRCPLCGDSKKNPHKTRGYIYTKSSCLHFKCHNCGAQSSLSNLIKNVNSSLYDQYRLERYREGLDIGQYAKAEKNPFTMATPEFEDKTILDKLFTRLDRLPETNIAGQYVLNRKIPKEKFSELFFVENIKDIEQLSDKYKNKIDGKEPRLVIPFYNKKGVLAGVSCRALGNESLRYLTIRIANEAQMIYNIDRVDTRKPIFCVEGPFDSMFLPNAVAVGNSDLTIIDKYVPKSITTLIF